MEDRKVELKSQSVIRNITIGSYKGFKDITIGTFNKINIIAGDNNVGKTSFLEAIFLLFHLNDVDGLFQINKRRAKIFGDLKGELLERLIPEGVHISSAAIFEIKQAKLQILKDYNPSFTIDKSNYLKTLIINASFENKRLAAKVDVHQNRHSVYYDEQHKICPIVFSSPFTFLDRKLIEQYHEIAVEKGILFTIINFIKKEIDNGFNFIHKVGDGDLTRFVVEHEELGAIDLTDFGDGVQRVFYIGMMIAAAQDGVICIDEIENAIHYKLLVRFTKLIQELAERFNVQVFATSHSNECIKAFFGNGYKNEDISGFRLEKKIETASESGAGMGAGAGNEDGSGIGTATITYKMVEGRKFQNQIENFSLDLRG